MLLGNNKIKKIPVYYITRIFILTNLIYLALIFSYISIIILKSLPLILNIFGISDLLFIEDGIRKFSVYNNYYFEKNPIESAIIILFKYLFVSYLIIMLINLPIKLYFWGIKKAKKKFFYRYTKKMIFKTPLINSSLMALSYISYHISIFLIFLPLRNKFPEIYSSLIKYIFISLISSMLAVLLMYVWQNHRVRFKYIDYIFKKSDLILFKKINIFSSIKSRLLFSNIMTTILPISVIMIYIYSSLTAIDLRKINYDEIKLLMGNYGSILITADSKGKKFLEYVIENSDKAYFITIPDTLLMLSGIISGIFISLLYIYLFVRWTTEDIIYPLNELLENIENIKKGSYYNLNVIRNNDEIGNLAYGFNSMTLQLQEKISEIKLLNNTYYKFVPREFIEYLGKKDITKLRLGDNIKNNLFIMFTDIRDFTKLSENMKPEDIFNLLNKYFINLEKVIINYRGFIDKYIGDGIMALFPDTTTNILECAIKMQESIDEINLKYNINISMGIGIHYGEVILGIIGGYNRMDGTVISDAVNVASRLEGLTKYYKSYIIFSEDVLNNCSINLENYKIRNLDIVRLKGKSKPVKIYDIKSDLTDDYLDMYNKAIEFYRNNDSVNAKNLFNELLKKYPDDEVLKIYLERLSDNKKINE